MPRQKITPEERRHMRDFLAALADTYDGGWDKLMDDSGVPRSTHPAWRYKNPSSGPSTQHLLSILQTAGVLHDAAIQALRKAARVAAEGSAAAPNGRPARADQAQDA